LASEIRQYSLDGWHGWDHHGSPIFIQRFGRLNLSQLISLATPDQRLFYLHFINEYMQSILLPQASQRAGVHIDTMTSIFDMQGLSMSAISKHNLQFVKASIHASSLIYPESMRVTMIINTPRVFSIAWNLVKGFIDAETRAKISITKDNAAEEWSKYGIDRQGLPVALGGQCTCGEHDDEDGWQGCVNCSAQVKAFEEFVHQQSSSASSSSQSLFQQIPAVHVSDAVHDLIAAETDSDDDSNTSGLRRHSNSGNSNTSGNSSGDEDAHEHDVSRSFLLSSQDLSSPARA